MSGILFIFILLNISHRYAYTYFNGGIIEEQCQNKCRCTREENSSKVQVAHCIIDVNDNFLECNVEWTVLVISVKSEIFNKKLLHFCQGIKRLKITSESSTSMLKKEMFQSNSLIEILVIQAPIQTIEAQFLKFLTSLKMLHISETNVERLDKQMFQYCFVNNEIRLSSNLISVLADKTFENCISLRKLDLSHNRISTINYLTFNKGDHLEVLDLSKNKINKIESFSFRNLRALKALYLNENQLKAITKDTFGHMDNLNHLILFSNQIDFIAFDSFSGLKSIKVINLKNNLLQRLNLALFLNLNKLKIIVSHLKCVEEGENEYLHVSGDVRKEFEKFPLCSGKRIRNEIENQKFIQQNSVSEKPEKPTTRFKENVEPTNIFDSHPFLFPMIFGGLAVLLISIIVIALVCHVKNKQINELKMQEIPLPMMQSTL